MLMLESSYIRNERIQLYTILAKFLDEIGGQPVVLSSCIFHDRQSISRTRRVGIRYSKIPDITFYWIYKGNQILIEGVLTKECINCKYIVREHFCFPSSYTREYAR